VALVVFAFGFTACGSTTTRTVTVAGRTETITRTETVVLKPSPPPKPKPKPKTGAAAWNDEIVQPYAVSERDVYETSRDTCGLFTPKQVAAEYGASSSTADAAAQAYADASYQRPLRAAALAGCLAGFRRR
jgi:hypothetical protein